MKILFDQGTPVPLRRQAPPGNLSPSRDQHGLVRGVVAPAG